MATAGVLGPIALKFKTACVLWRRGGFLIAVHLKYKNTRFQIKREGHDILLYLPAKRDKIISMNSEEFVSTRQRGKQR